MNLKVKIEREKFIPENVEAVSNHNMAESVVTFNCNRIYRELEEKLKAVIILAFVIDSRACGPL